MNISHLVITIYEYQSTIIIQLHYELRIFINLFINIKLSLIINIHQYISAMSIHYILNRFITLQIFIVLIQLNHIFYFFQILIILKSDVFENNLQIHLSLFITNLETKYYNILCWMITLGTTRITKITEIFCNFHIITITIRSVNNE